LDHHQLIKLSPYHVQAMLNEKLATSLSPRTVQYLRAVLRQALGQAVKWGQVPRNVATLVDPPRSVRQEIRPLTDAEAHAFLDVIAGDRLEAMYLTALTLGLRQGELIGLRWQDVDVDARQVRIRSALQRIGREWQFVDPKSTSGRRTLPLPAVLVAALQRHQSQQHEARLLAGPRWQEFDLVFPSTIGTPQEARNVTTRFQVMLERAGLPRRRFHDLRHSCGTFLYASGVDPRTIMAILGHSQISLTMNTYVHAVEALQHEALTALERRLAGPKV
jgi:integrase